MTFQLSEIERFCGEEGLAYAFHGQDELRVNLTKSAVLCFVNLVSERDTLIGFLDVPTHTHDSWMIMTGADTYVELGPIDLLKGWLVGDLLICSSTLDGVMRDQRLVHRLERQSLDFVAHGECVSFETRPNQ